MLLPYRIPPSTETNHTREQKTPYTTLDGVKVTFNDLKMTSNDLKTTSNEPVEFGKTKLKDGGNIEINETYSDEIVHNIYL